MNSVFNMWPKATNENLAQKFIFDKIILWFIVRKISD